MAALNKVKGELIFYRTYLVGGHRRRRRVIEARLAAVAEAIARYPRGSSRGLRQIPGQ